MSSMPTIRTSLATLAAAAALIVAGCSGPTTVTPTAATVQAQTSAPTTSSRYTPPPPTVRPSTTAPAPTTTAAPPPAAVGVAQLVTATSLDGTKSTATVTVQSARWSLEAGAPYPVTPKHGAFLIVDVSIEGVTGSSHYNPYDWSVRDAEGRSYSPSIGQPDPGLRDGYAEPGDLGRGFIAFDAPQGPVTLVMGNRPGVRWVIAS